MNHSFDIDDAKKYGVPQATILYNIRYWIEYNKANRENIHDGRVWTYNSVRAYSELFPYFTADQIRRYVESLETEGAIIPGNYNKRGGDRTKWHTIPGELGEAPADHLAESPLHLADLPEQMAKSPNGNGGLATALPDINPNTKPVENTHTQERWVEIFKRLAEPFKLYNQHIRPADMVSMDYAIRRAVSLTSPEIVEYAILQVVDERLSDTGKPLKYFPHMGNLLGDSDKLKGRASDYRPTIAHPETGPPPTLMESLRAMNPEERARQVKFAIKNGLKLPEEVESEWPELIQKTA